MGERHPRPWHLRLWRTTGPTGSPEYWVVDLAGSLVFSTPLQEVAAAVVAGVNRVETDPVGEFAELIAALAGPGASTPREMYAAPVARPARDAAGHPRGWMVRWALDAGVAVTFRVDDRGKLTVSLAVAGEDDDTQLRWDVDPVAVGELGQRLVGLAGLASAMPGRLYYACPAHGDAACAACAATVPAGLDGCGGCTGCDFYDLSGMHWDTCSNRVRAVATG